MKRMTHAEQRKLIGFLRKRVSELEEELRKVRNEKWEDALEAKWAREAEAREIEGCSGYYLHEPRWGESIYYTATTSGTR